MNSGFCKTCGQRLLNRRFIFCATHRAENKRVSSKITQARRDEEAKIHPFICANCGSSQLGRLNQKYCSMMCKGAFDSKRRVKDQMRKNGKCSYFAVGGAGDDNQHPNDRGRDMSRYVGTFTIQEGVVLCVRH